MKKFLPFIIWTVIIFGLCSMPGKAIPRISWLELLSFDKFVHAGIFFVEQVLFMRALSNTSTQYELIQISLLWRGKGEVKKNKLIHSEHWYNLNKKTFYGLLALLFCILYGGSLELMQFYIFSSRSGDILDFAANTTGALIGFFLFSKINKKLGFLPC